MRACRGALARKDLLGLLEEGRGGNCRFACVHVVVLANCLDAACAGWRYGPEHPPAENCLPLQLQRLFSLLQLSERGAVTTGELTRSFGWRDSEAFVQHDVQVGW